MADLALRKSSYSRGEEECVEVATNVPDAVAIRDSKNPAGPMLRFTPAAWVAFQVVLAEEG
ncbi:DUF397 domain-containing protein [Streptomyces violaceusniger]|uniref:DUF397 domain-containing protein n=1 Tax=Streptomyces violaceusniger (strain Tu 4113) TaxID=653045 RepID=G2NT55_STRV4|nr:DUF397 domain-containing protein [Streptomyces violaceusniger]AEM81475.1 protein of unknown function DUF397 [Streptomyces violaceusniger Tu 4113]